MIEGLNETPRHWLPILGLHPETYQGHVQAQTAAQRFATVSGLNDMFPENGVQRGLRYVFSCLVGVSKNVSPISSDMYTNHAVLKRQLAQWVQVKLFTNMSAAARYTQKTCLS